MSSRWFRINWELRVNFHTGPQRHLPTFQLEVKLIIWKFETKVKKKFKFGAFPSNELVLFIKGGTLSKALTCFGKMSNNIAAKNSRGSRGYKPDKMSSRPDNKERGLKELYLTAQFLIALSVQLHLALINAVQIWRSQTEKMQPVKSTQNLLKSQPQLIHRLPIRHELYLQESKLPQVSVKTLQIRWFKNIYIQYIIVVVFLCRCFHQPFLAALKQGDGNPAIDLCVWQNVSERLEYKISRGKVRGLQQLKDFCLI